MTSLFYRLRRRRIAPTANTTSTQSTTPSITPSATPSRSTESTTPTQPLAEEPTQHEPPPYSASTTSPQAPTQQDSSSERSSGGRVMSHDITQGLLDPNLNFTAAQMEHQWKQKDIIFARAVVQFIAERFDGNLKGWAGYKYTYICEEENPPRKESAWDEILGYNAWSYRNRFRQVNILVKRDFERRGFEVRKCEVYCGVDGIYVEWSLEIRRSRSSK